MGTKLGRLYAELLAAPTIGDLDRGVFGAFALKRTDGAKVRYWLRKTGEGDGRCGGPYAQVLEERVKRGWWTITDSAWPALPAGGVTAEDEREAAQAHGAAQAALYAWENARCVEWRRPYSDAQLVEFENRRLEVRCLEWRMRAIAAARKVGP